MSPTTHSTPARDSMGLRARFRIKPTPSCLRSKRTPTTTEPTECGGHHTLLCCLLIRLMYERDSTAQRRLYQNVTGYFSRSVWRLGGPTPLGRSDRRALHARARLTGHVFLSNHHEKSASTGVPSEIL